MKRLFAALALAAAASAADTQWVTDLGGSATKDAKGRVTALNLRGSWVEDADLRHLAELPDLTSLDLSLTHISDQGMAELKALKNVADLNLYFTEYVTDQGLSAIHDWKNLRRLNLHGTKVGDAGLEHIAGMTKLEWLDVGSTLMTDVGLERLTSLTNLRELTMGGNELGDAGLQALRQMPGLTYLDLSGRQGTDKNVWTIHISEPGLDAVLALKSLRELRLGCNSLGVGIEGQRLAEVSVPNITARWVDKIRTLPKLESLRLQGCERISDDAVPSLAAMPALRLADLQGTGISETAAVRLREQKPGLKLYTGAWKAPSAGYRNN